MSNDREISPLDESSNRQIWVGWGSGVVCTALAFLVGGVFVPYLLLFVGATMALRGHWPGLFAKHIDAQIIAGIPYRREESSKSWSIALLVCFLLAFASSWIHRTIAPTNTDVAKTVIDGVKRIVEQQNKIPTSIQPTTPTLIPAPPQSTRTTGPTSPTSRANLYCQGVTLRIYENGPEKDHTIKFPDITGRVNLQNIGGSPLTSQAIIAVGATVSEKLNVDGLDHLFHTGYGKRAALTPFGLAPGANFPVDFKSPLITPGEWNDVKGGTRLIYITVEANFSDRYGRRRSEYCSYFKSAVGVAGMYFLEQSCVLHNGAIDVQ
jgi:hypothetical protein